MFEPLRTAIAAQYAAFRALRPRVVTGCSCCTSPDDLAALVAAPREELGAGALAFYAHKAMTTVGTVEDFRYFWPRLAELALDAQFLTSTETVFGKPAYGAHHAWPAEEQEAIRSLAAALGAWVAAEELEPDLVDSWVCAIGLLSEKLDDPRRFLSPLLADAPVAWGNLRALVEWNEDTVRRKGRLASSFWENAPEGAALMLDWLQTEPRLIEAARAVMTEKVERYGFVPPAS
jgi:hypothetical protein